ncbi:MAG: bifunctional riboflavin kinase/FAD synthetase [Burkholderiales bacterium]|nr:bifunctional riboflavin kinase/FAD synthetase [Burkholderiales bacterium]
MNSIEIVRTLPATAQSGAPVALALGNFDGVHRGHQAMLRRVVEAAGDLDLIPAVMTFEPTPREYFAPTATPAGLLPQLLPRLLPRLLPLRSRLERIAETGIARIYLLRFDARLAEMDAEVFVGDLLERRLNVRWFLATHDARFGKNRAGDLDFLRARSNAFMLETMATVEIDGKRVSSTAIRQALAAADFVRAGQLLGRPYTIAGRVTHGEARGRMIGFPTMNVPLTFTPPLSGVFAVRVYGLGAVREGVANLGVRPTVHANEANPVLETHVFDFNEDTYGRRIEVEFVKKLRDESRFADVAALKKQIESDARQAREVFSPVLCAAC